MVQLVDFYTVLSGCVKSKLCDKDTAISVFAPYVSQFFVHHSIFICRQIRNWHDKKFAEGVLELVVLFNDSRFTVKEYTELTCDQVDNLKDTPAS